MLRPIPAATNALSSFPQVFSCVSPRRANQKLICWVNCTGLFLIMNFIKNCGTHERIKILPGHSSCHQCTFVVPAGFFLCFSLKSKSKTNFWVNCTRLFLIMNFNKNCGNYERIKILPAVVPGHSSCQQCTFVVPAGFFLCFSLKTKSKTNFSGELHRIISCEELHS